jgi:hypothetical protein
LYQDTAADIERATITSQGEDMTAQEMIKEAKRIKEEEFKQDIVTERDDFNYLSICFEAVKAAEEFELTYYRDKANADHQKNLAAKAPQIDVDLMDRLKDMMSMTALRNKTK